MMTDWLSEIEETLRVFREEGVFPDGEVPEERMARVIRELVGILKLAKGLWDIGGEKNCCAVCDAMINLSPDAKELLDENSA